MAFLAIEEIVGERMSVSALRVLSRVEGGLSGSEVARRLGAQQSTVRKALERLVERGLVSRQNIGRTASYRLDERRAATRDIVIPAFQAEAELRLTLWSEVLTLGNRLRPRPTAIVVYGSVAKGGRAPRDIDLLIVTNTEADTERLRDQIADMGAQFESRYLLPLSPVFVSKGQIDSDLGETLLYSVLPAPTHRMHSG